VTDDRPRRLRAFYRDSTRRGEPWIATKEHFRTLFGRHPERGEAEQMVVNAWTEERGLRGERYDFMAQCWRNAAGERVD
jgi:hypothetical protein